MTKEGEEPIITNESESSPVLRLKAVPKDFEGTYKGTFTNLEGKSFPATFTVTIDTIRSETSAFVTVKFDFGEIRFNGCDMQGNPMKILLVIRENDAVLNTTLADISFSSDARTMKYQTENYVGGKTIMTGTKQ